MQDSAVIRLEIEAARARVAADAAALAYRADVKTRLNEEIADRVAAAKLRARATIVNLSRNLTGAARSAGTTATAVAADAVETARPHIVEASKTVADAKLSADEVLIVATQTVGEVVEAARPHIVDASQATAKNARFVTRNVFLFALASLSAGLYLWFVLAARRQDGTQERDAAA